MGRSEHGYGGGKARREIIALVTIVVITSSIPATVSAQTWYLSGERADGKSPFSGVKIMDSE